MELSDGALLASNGSVDSGGGSGDEEGLAGSNGAARRREGSSIGSWPFNLGSLVSSLAGGKPPGSDSSSSGSRPGASRNGSSPNGAGSAAGAASNGSSSSGEGAGRDSTIDPQVGGSVRAGREQGGGASALVLCCRARCNAPELPACQPQQLLPAACRPKSCCLGPTNCRC